MAMTDQAARETAERPSLRLSRVFDAPRISVFDAFIRPEMLSQWWGPEGYTVPRVEIDATPGGRYRIEISAPDGEKHCVIGVFREVSAPDRLVYTFAWESTPERESLVTVEFFSRGDATELVLNHTMFADEAARDGHQAGWTSSFICLERFLGDRSS